MSQPLEPLSLSDAMIKAREKDIFVDFEKYGQIWRVGAIFIPKNTSRLGAMTPKLMQKFESYGWDYIGDKNEKYIFRRKMKPEEGKSGFKNLQHFYDTLF
jgi:hypothetical protein